MFKIKTISEMEQDLLAKSDSSDVVGGKPVAHDANKILSKQDVQRDIATYARVLINVYCGWPFHNAIVKRKVLKKLLSFYKNAHEMTAKDLYNELKDVIAIIPDNHIWLNFDRRMARCASERKLNNVGKNLAQPNTMVTQMYPGNVAVIAFFRMYRDKWVADQLLAFKDSIDKSSALIVDLRGNGGGSSRYSDKLAEYLFGTEVRSAKKTFVRNNPDAQRFLKMARPDGAWWDSVSGHDDPLLCPEDSLTQFNAKDGYDKPIYILTDGKTGSSSEMFLLRMLHHPRVRVVGDNSAGMEVFGNMGTGFLPVSNITFGIGMNYRELEFDNFELRGYKPDIKCRDGQDAFVVAMNDFQRQSLMSNGGLVR